MNKPQVGSRVKVVVRHVGFEPVFVPVFKQSTPAPVDYLEYQGEVVRPPDLSLGPWEFGLTTTIPDFPVRVIDMRDVISIDGTASIDESHQVHIVNVQGSKGNVYQVQVQDGKAFSCTCPAFVYRKQQCKHLAMATGEAPPVEVKPPVERTEGPSKASLAKAIFQELNGDRKACIVAFMEKLSMSKASAQTYFYNIKGASK